MKDYAQNPYFQIRYSTKMHSSKTTEPEINPIEALSSEDKEHILIVFHEEIVPKLANLDARLGNLNCEFAGDRYRNWSIQFKSAGSGYEIVDFEYDEQGTAMDLDL